MRERNNPSGYKDPKTGSSKYFDTLDDGLEASVRNIGKQYHKAGGGTDAFTLDKMRDIYAPLWDSPLNKHWVPMVTKNQATFHYPNAVQPGKTQVAGPPQTSQSSQVTTPNTAGTQHPTYKILRTRAVEQGTEGAPGLSPGLFSKTPMKPPAAAGASGGSVDQAIKTALAMEGYGENNNKARDLEKYMKVGRGGLRGENQAWCAKFVNTMIAEAGGTGTKDKAGNTSWWAKDFLKWGKQVTGKDDINKLDVVVWDRGGSKGHVSSFTGVTDVDQKTGQKRYQIVEGNVSDQIKTGWLVRGADGRFYRTAKAAGGAGWKPRRAAW